MRAGHFTAIADGLPTVTAMAHDFVAGDFDRDGDLDAFLATQGTPRLYWNLSHHLAWRELPRLGRPLTMELTGAANEPFAFVASPVRLEFPVPPFGVLQVDIGSALLLELGALDAQGRARRTYQVPANPAFLGADVYWQAVTGTAPRLGNLEITTLLGN